MNFTTSYDEDAGVLTLSVTGTHVRPDDSHQLLRVAGAFARLRRCTRYLFDMRAAEIVGGTMDAYETAVDPERHGFSRFFRIASVYSGDLQGHKFMEDVAFNRGATGFRVFDRMDEAKVWLHKE